MSLRAIGQANVTMSQLQQQMDVIGHNLSNLNTTGYKSQQTEFQSILFQHVNNLKGPESARDRVTPEGIRIGTGAKLGAINSDLSIGYMQTTERALDTMLLNNQHFYQVGLVENGEDVVRYTRDGTFYLSPINDGQQVRLVNQDGNPLLGANGPIEFAANFDEIQIRDNGNIVLLFGEQEQVVGKLAISNVIRPRVLESIGGNLFQMPDLDALGLQFNEIVHEAPQDEPLLRSGVIEMSNVRLQDEMVQLMGAQRSYQLNARTITMADQMQGLVNQLR